MTNYRYFIFIDLNYYNAAQYGVRLQSFVVR